MRFPYLEEIRSTRDPVDVFRGYNRNLRIGDGEFYEMQNMASDQFPILAPRRKRGVYAATQAASALIAKDSLCYVDGGDFVMNGYHVPMELSTEEDMLPKRLVSMGAYVVILPDKKYINTADLTEYGNIEARYVSSEPVTFTLCRLDGSEYTAQFTQTEEPANPTDKTLWMDISAKPHVLRQWNSLTGMWVSITSTYVKISAPGIGQAFSNDDGVTISGLEGGVYTDGNGNALACEDLAELNGTAVVCDRGDNHILVTGMLSAVRTIRDSITIAREMPHMDFLVESENRLWGCRYGTARNGQIVNEIYASKLGDFKNWNCFMGISTDSYAASVGTDGQFTGAITMPGCVIFFKEGCLHKVYGNYPANFRIQTTVCRGVQRGCEGSLAMVNEVVYYKARHAVCAYDGSLPVEISGALGDRMYRNAVGGAHGGKYYISMEDTQGGWNLFVYDTAKGLWHREDDLRVDCFCSCREEMYAIAHDTGNILGLLGTCEPLEDKIEWMVTTGPLTMELPDAKYISRLLLRLSMDLGSTIRVRIQYDSVGPWEYAGDIRSLVLRTFSIPVVPRRCDHFRLRLEGIGDARIYSITKELQKGSDIL